MRLLLGGGLSLILPLAAGWAIATALWPESLLILRFALSLASGLGLAGTTYLAALALTNSSQSSLTASELVLLGVFVLVMFRGRKVSAGESNAKTHPPRNSANPKILAAGILVLAVASGALFFVADYSGAGGWDAVALWNTKARFIYRSTAAPLDRITDPESEHPDYPLLLPSMVAREWQYAGRDSRVFPLGIAVLFTILTFTVMVGGLRRVSGGSQAWLAGCVLLGTPFFLQHGVSQYADIVLCCFITTTVVAFCVHDAIPGSSWRLPLLAGLMAGFAACTKNEGLLFVLIVAVSRLLLLLWRKAGWAGVREIGVFSAGASSGLIALVLFKSLHSPPNPIVGNLTGPVIMGHIQSYAFHATIWKGFAREFHDFGAWWIYPVPLLLIHFIFSRIGAVKRLGFQSWPMPALVLLGMIAGYYAVYMFGPADLEWQISTSLSRLLLQIWPTALVLYATASSSPNAQAAAKLAEGASMG
jgi:hypothetical protein